MDTIETTPDRPQPVAETGQRIASLDFIRGLAVMGILAANIFAMGQPFPAYMFPDAFTVPPSGGEDWMWTAQFVLIDGKMRGLFSLLFGAGLYLFMEKTWAKGGTVWLQVKRLLWLGLFGLIHFYFIWRGDILFLYAVCGLLTVLMFIGMSVRKQLVIGILAYIVGAILYGAMTIFMQVAADSAPGDNPVAAQMQEELKALQKQLGITFVFVTHDQGEALSMADRVAIFNEGKIVQAGSPADVYERPRSRFVADFVGSSNVLPPAFSTAHGGPSAWTSLRPEKIRLLATGETLPAGHHAATGKVTAVHYQGSIIRLVADVSGTRLTAALPAGSAAPPEGASVTLVWDAASPVAMEPA